jgi:hypothetical protein
LALLLVQSLRHAMVINHDAAMYLQAAQLLLAGNIPYVDFIDLNPPMIVYISALPAGIAQLLGASPIAVFHGFVWIQVYISTVVIGHLMRSVPTLETHGTTSLIVLAWVFVSAVAAYRYDAWGQREHLFILWLAPLLLLRGLGRRGQFGTALRICVGFAGGVVACMKPHFALIMLVPELYWAVRHRSIRAVLQPEVVAFGAAVSAFVLHFLLVPDSMRHEFFQRWVPFIAAGYDAYDVPLASVLSRRDVHLATIVLLFGLVAGLVERPPRTPTSDLIVPTALAGLAAVFGFVVQRKDWSYQLLPGFGLAVLLIAMLLPSYGGRFVAAAKAARVGRALPWLRIATQIIASLVVIAFVRSGLAHVDGLGPEARLIEAFTRPRDRVMVVSTSVGPAYPALLQTDRLPGSRYLFMFPIPMFYHGELAPDSTARYHTLEAAPPAEQRFLGELQEDLARLRPAMVLVDNDRRCQACPPRFDLLEYLEKSGFSERAMRDYRLAQRVGGWAIFTRISD